MGRFARHIAFAAALATIVSSAACGHSGRSHAAKPSPSVRQAAVTVVGTLRLPPSDSPLFAATGQRAFVVVVPPQGHETRVMAIAGDGRVMNQRRLVFRHARDIADVSLGPAGLYVGTAVIHRFFPNVPDHLVRIDPTTLAIVATASFPFGVEVIAQGQGLWATIGDGRVVRLDPRTLAIRASQRVAPPPTGDIPSALSAPALGAGSLWVLAGDEPHLKLVRMDPTSLAVRSRTTIHGPGGLSPKVPIYHVIAGNDHVYLVGEDVLVPVNASGRQAGRPLREPWLDAVVVDGSTLVALGGAPSELIWLTAEGRLFARTALRDSSGLLAVSGRDAWFLGDAGRGEGIVHVRLNSP